VAHIHNTTNRTITFSRKWGWEGSCKQYTLAPGQSKALYWRYQNDEHESPELFIKYKGDQKHNSDLRIASVQRYRSPSPTDPDYGTDYNFVSERGGFIGLRALHGKKPAFVANV
jgi:hypothetical protein